MDTHVSNSMVSSTHEWQVFRFGGLAGLVGSAVLLFVFGFTATVVGDDPATPVGMIERFPGVRTARTIENSFYLMSLVLWAVHSLALYWALRTTNIASALFGGLLSILGITILAVGALPHVASVPLADLYHAGEAGAADKAALANMFKASWAIFDAMLIAGLTVLPFGTLLFGMGMVNNPAYGRGLGIMSIVFGLIGIASALVVLIDPASLFAAGGVFSALLFHLIVGWKTKSIDLARQA